MALELRYLTAADLRADPGSAEKPARLVGYAATFNDLSVDLGGFRERIAPGAFAGSLASKADIRALVDHEAGKILGRTSNGTLTLSEDAKGLRVEITPPDTSYARDMMESVRRGDIGGMSFGFLIPPDGDTFSRDNSGQVIRELRAIDLHEVTVTSIPAYPSTQVSLRVDPAAIAKAAEENKYFPERLQREKRLREIICCR